MSKKWKDIRKPLTPEAEEHDGWTALGQSHLPRG